MAMRVKTNLAALLILLLAAPALAANHMDHYFGSGGIKGMAYQPTPTDYFVPAPVKYGNTDFYNSDFQALWGADAKGVTRTVHVGGETKHQGDLQTLHDMGVNLVRLYSWQGMAGWVDHSPFLDECDRLGIKVIVPIFVTGDSSTTSQFYKNIESIINETSGHSSVAFYSIGNEISPSAEPDVFQTIKVYADRARALLDQKGAKQMIISPTWGSVEARGWFTSHKVAIDAWAFNVYDPDTINGLARVIKDKTLDGKPVFFSEYGVDAFNNATSLQDETMQAKAAAELITPIYANLDKFWGGTWFEFSDERWKGLDKNEAGGQADRTATASTYLNQAGGSYPTSVGGSVLTIPAQYVGACTYGWRVGWTPDKVMNEGYFGMGYLSYSGKEAQTVKNGESRNYQNYPWIYRVDDLHLRAVHETLKTQFR